MQTLQDRQGLKIACLEEIALHMGYLSPEHLVEAGSRMKSDYGRYIVEIAREALATAHDSVSTLPFRRVA